MATMLRWRWVLLAWMIGGCLLAYGVLVEIELRREVGGGLRRFLAKTFYGGMIEEYRWLSMLCAVIGPLIITAAFLLRRRWDARRTADWLEAKARRCERRSSRRRQQAERWGARDQRASRRASQGAERLQRKADTLRCRAERLRSR